MTEPVLVENSGGVRYLRLNRPEKLNAMNPDFKRQLIAEVDAAGHDPSVRCVVLTGVGRAFSAGGDIGSMREEEPIAEGVERTMRASRISTALAELRKPVVAGVNGLAAGSGFSLALACDVIVAAESAWFSQQFRDRGLIPDSGSTYFLARQVGLYRAKELVFSGRRIPASEAAALGIVSQVWGDDFEQRLEEYAQGLAAGPTVALGLAKRLIDAAFETPLNVALEREALAQGIAMGTEDHRGSVASYRAKEPPSFNGR